MTSTFSCDFAAHTSVLRDLLGDCISTGSLRLDGLLQDVFAGHHYTHVDHLGLPTKSQASSGFGNLSTGLEVVAAQDNSHDVLPKSCTSPFTVADRASPHGPQCQTGRCKGRGWPSAQHRCTWADRGPRRQRGPRETETLVPSSEPVVSSRSRARTAARLSSSMKGVRYATACWRLIDH